MKHNKFINIVILLLILLSVIRISYAEDTDKDGMPDSEDPYPFDFDNDGIPDLWEKKYGLKYDMDDSKEDPDNDGLTNLEEYQIGTDPLTSNLPEDITYQKKFVEVIPGEQLSPIDLLKKYLIYIILILLIAAVIVYRKELEKLIEHIRDKIREKREAKKSRLANPQPYTPRGAYQPRTPPRPFYPRQVPRPPIRQPQQYYPNPHSPVVRVIPSKPILAPKQEAQITKAPPIRPVQSAPLVKEEPIEKESQSTIADKKREEIFERLRNI